MADQVNYIGIQNGTSRLDTPGTERTKGVHGVHGEALPDDGQRTNLLIFETIHLPELFMLTR